jgi:hypothetical protein
MIAMPEQAPAPPHGGAADEMLLHAVRRADWRFLLPDPALGRVAYLGPHDEELVRALERVSPGVALVEPGDAAAPSHDVAVATGAGPAAVPQLVPLLRPGGWLYAETTGRAAARWCAALRAAGLEGVEAWWLWPDAARPKELVPLDDPAAIRHALGRRDPGARLRPRAWAARALLASGLLRRVIPAAAVVGRRPLAAGEAAPAPQDGEGA